MQIAKNSCHPEIPAISSTDLNMAMLDSQDTCTSSTPEMHGGYFPQFFPPTVHHPSPILPSTSLSYQSSSNSAPVVPPHQPSAPVVVFTVAESEVFTSPLSVVPPTASPLSVVPPTTSPLSVAPPTTRRVVPSFCHCRTRCHSGKSCPCKKLKVLCTVQCHPGHTCTNCKTSLAVEGSVDLTLKAPDYPQKTILKPSLSSEQKRILCSKAWLDDTIFVHYIILCYVP